MKLLLTIFLFISNLAWSQTKTSIELSGVNNQWSIETSYTKSSQSNWVPLFIYKDYYFGQDVFQLQQLTHQLSKSQKLFANINYQEQISQTIEIPITKKIGLHLGLSENLMLQSRLNRGVANMLINGSNQNLGDTLDYSGSFIHFMHYQKINLGLNFFSFNDSLKRHFEFSPRINFYVPNQYFYAFTSNGRIAQNNDPYYSVYSQALIYGNTSSFNEGIFKTNGWGLGMDLNFKWYFENDYQINFELSDIAYIRLFNNYHFQLAHEINYDGIDIINDQSGNYNQINNYKDTLGIRDTNAEYNFLFPSSFELSFSKILHKNWTLETSFSNFLRYNVPLRLEINCHQKIKYNWLMNYGIAIGGFGQSAICIGSKYSLGYWQFSLQTFNLMFDHANTSAIEARISKTF